MEMSLRHMMWADDRLFRELAALPAESLKFTYAAPEWSVGHIARHIVQGGEWYRYIFTKAQWRDLEVPASAEDLEALRVYLMEIYDVLLAEVAGPDELVEFDDEGGLNAKPRAMILAQAVYHSIEHRTQIATTLEVNGNKAIDLDSYDLWHYLAQSRG